MNSIFPATSTVTERGVQEFLRDPKTLKEINSILRSNGIDPIHPWLRLDIESTESYTDLHLDPIDLQALFSYFGDILEIRVLPEQQCSAHILFSNIVSAFFAQQVLHQYSLPQYSAKIYLRWIQCDSDCKSYFSPSEKTVQRRPLRVRQTENVDRQNSFKKYTCRFEIQIENDSRYQVSRRLIGPKGSNMKKILKECTKGSKAPVPSIIKLRLRGKGSGFLEGPKREECKEPLHLCISTCFHDKYLIAKKRVSELLTKIYADYKNFCLKIGKLAPNLKVKIKEDVKTKQTKNSHTSETMGVRNNENLDPCCISDSSECYDYDYGFSPSR